MLLKRCCRKNQHLKYNDRDLDSEVKLMKKFLN